MCRCKSRLGSEQSNMEIKILPLGGQLKFVILVD